MKVSTVETILCDAGWRNYYFVKLTTDNGIVGWSEYDEGFGSPGVGAIIEQMGRRLAVTTRCDSCIAAHASAARSAGVTEAELSDALGTAIALSAGAAYSYSVRAMEAFGQFEAK